MRELRRANGAFQRRRTRVDAIELELGVDILLLDLLVRGHVDTRARHVRG